MTERGRHTLVRILADMIEVALDRRNALRYGPDHEKEVPDLQNNVRQSDDVAAVLQPGVQGEGLPPQTQEGE